MLHIYIYYTIYYTIPCDIPRYTIRVPIGCLDPLGSRWCMLGNPSMVPTTIQVMVLGFRVTFNHKNHDFCRLPMISTKGFIVGT